LTRPRCTVDCINAPATPGRFFFAFGYWLMAVGSGSVLLGASLCGLVTPFGQ
jgi:hypothetical protein